MAGPQRDALWAIQGKFSMDNQDNQSEPDAITREDDTDDTDDTGYEPTDTNKGDPYPLHAILVTVIASAVCLVRLVIIIGILVAMFHSGGHTDKQMSSSAQVSSNWSTELNGTTSAEFPSTNPPILGSTDGITFGGRGKKPGKFNSPFAIGLAVSTGDQIFVTDEHNRRIQVFNMNGTFLREFPTRKLRPRDIALDRSGALWVLFSRNKDKGDAVVKYSNEGLVSGRVKSLKRGLMAFGIALDTLSDNVIVIMTTGAEVFGRDGSIVRTFGRELGTPLGVVVDNDGNIYITDASTKANFVFKYDKNGEFLVKFGGTGSGPGNLKSPMGICVDSLGHLIVADSGNGRVVMFTRDGDHIRTVANVEKPSHVATGGEGQLVVTSRNHTVTIFPKYDLYF
ncbi:hypothetical protein Bbelb_260060 [Branchiostoma belcheri]|nr:hypothetical protein Bbelb_260060 [Branchiostoma belcheri]